MTAEGQYYPNIPGDWIIPNDGSTRYFIDLTEFAFGKEKLVEGTTWVRDFNGRKGFANDLVRLLVATSPPELSSRGPKTALRNLLRYLDEIDPGLEIKSCADLHDHHGPAILAALGNRYGLIKGFVDGVRRARNQPPLYWVPVPAKIAKTKEDIEGEAIQKLYLVLKAEARLIKAMFAEGAALAANGCDPRLTVDENPTAENLAWLVRELTSDTMIDGSRYVDACGGRAELKQGGPSYRVPGASEHYGKGLANQLRWFHPSAHETIVMLWLFLVGTGWNLGTALSIDVSSPEKWERTHPQKPDIKVISSFKARAGSKQFAVSMEKPEAHPYQIIKFMVERTAPLRRALARRRDWLIANGLNDPSTKREVSKIETAMKSPWLYHAAKPVGKVAALHDLDAPLINRVVQDIAASRALREPGKGTLSRPPRLSEDYPALLRLTTRQSRRAWIGYAHIESGQNVLITRLAAQHSDHSSLDHYLNRNSLRARNEQSARKMQNAIFGEIVSGRTVDPTRLRIIVEDGGITEEQERRLLDHRHRTRLGMGCLEPTNPPKSVAPDHVEGSVCRVQRCTGCQHGVVFEESLDALARARAELIRIKSAMPFSAWIGSSFEDEARSIDETLKSFDQDKVAASMSAWTGRLTNGEVAVHDVHPAYR